MLSSTSSVFASDATTAAIPDADHPPGQPRHSPLDRVVVTHLLCRDPCCSSRTTHVVFSLVDKGKF
jgi:hypothetical protein